MRFHVLIILFVCLCTASFAQSPIQRATDKYVESVNKFRNENALVKKQLEHKSLLGPEVAAYYLKKKLMLITTHYGGEFGYIDYSFYVENDSLLFVNEKKIILKEPQTEKEYSAYEKYVIFNTNKQGITDFSKWPLMVDLNNSYYIDNDSIIRYTLKNFSKPVKPIGNEIEESAKDLIYRFKTHLGEVRN